MATKRTISRTTVVPSGLARTWEAVSEPAQLSRWLGVPVAVEVRPGAVGTAGARVVQVEEVEPGRRLSFSWWAVGDGGEPPSRVAVVVEPAVDGTRVTVEETALDDLGGGGHGAGRDVLEASAR